MLMACGNANRVEIVENPPTVPTPQLSVESTPDNFPSDVQFEQWRKDSFQPVIDKWLNGERLPSFVELVRKDEFAGNSEREARLELLDVNGDRSKELAMQSGCSTVGNCAFWLFEKTPTGFRQLLAAEMVQQFKLRSTETNNYYDLETRAHGSSTSGGLAIYKFNGVEYKISECFGYEYERTGRMIKRQAETRDVPTLTPADCTKWPG